MYAILEFLWTIPAYQESIDRLSEEVIKMLHMYIPTYVCVSQ